MSDISGMEMAEVRKLVQTLRTAARDLQGAVDLLDQSVRATHWTGPDRERFLAEWQSAHAGSLRQLINGLEHGAETATRNLQQQENASRG